MFRKLKWIFRVLMVVVLIGGAWYWWSGPEIRQGSYLVVDLTGSLEEGQTSTLVSRLLHRGRTLVDVTNALRKVRYDGRIAGVLVRLGPFDGGWGQTQELRGALSLVKAQGKKVIALLEVELEPASREIYLASVADKVYVAPAAAPMFNGLAARFVFLGAVWPKIDVNMQVEKIREYKSAGDELSRESMSQAHREMAESLLTDTGNELLQTIAVARNLTVAEVQAIAERCPSSGPELVSAGLADAVKSRGEIVTELGNGEAVPTVTEETYAGVSLSSLGIGDGPRIAIVHASGAINRGDPSPGRKGVASHQIATALQDAAADSSILAIVLRVASPGGSPAASDEIWLEVREAAKKKPVIASMGDVAASGGYYIASAADRIVASPGTITGSIGVVMFKPDVSALLTRMGVHTESLSRGRFARLLDMDKSFDEAELTLIRKQMNDIYWLFLDRVATGRKMKKEDVDKIGGGRVWTGQQASHNGLVDELGGLSDAVRVAAAAAGIHDPDKVRLVHYPASGLLDAGMLRAGASVVAAELEPPIVRMVADTLEPLQDMLSLEPGVQVLAPDLPRIE